MRIVARGWSRNMGNTEIVNIELSELGINRSESRSIYWDRPGLFGGMFRTFVAWGKNLRLTGSYRLEVEFSSADILQLFKARFGSVLDTMLLDEYGFTVSPEFEKAVLSKIKLADVTLGDLMKIGVASTEEVAPADKSAADKSANLGLLRGRLS